MGQAKWRIANVRLLRGAPDGIAGRLERANPKNIATAVATARATIDLSGTTIAEVEKELEVHRRNTDRRPPVAATS
jgi:hypothetical protein